jgi:hypothetical protein
MADGHLSRRVEGDSVESPHQETCEPQLLERFVLIHVAEQVMRAEDHAPSRAAWARSGGTGRAGHAMMPFDDKPASSSRRDRVGAPRLRPVA